MRNARRLALCGCLAAGALILSFVESLLPLPLPVPGARLGLGNALVLLALLLLGVRAAAGVLAAKVLLSALLFGTPELFYYFTPLGLLAILTGGLSGLAAQLCAKRLRPLVLGGRV